MAFWLMTYDLADDYLERRGEFRAEHLAGLTELEKQGVLVLAGAVGTEKPAHACFVFSAETDEPARSWAGRDPYVAAGIVKAWHVERYMALVGTASH